MYALEVDELFHLLGRRVRVRNGKHTFVGILASASQRKFPRSKKRYVSGLVLEGQGYRLEFAWWDWDVTPVETQNHPLAAGSGSFLRPAFSRNSSVGTAFVNKSSVSEVLKPRRRDVEVAHRIFDVVSAEGEQAHIVPLVRERAATDVQSHVWAALEAELGLVPGETSFVRANLRQA